MKKSLALYYSQVLYVTIQALSQISQEASDFRDDTVRALYDEVTGS
jgi:hypothetical protein